MNQGSKLASLTWPRAIIEKLSNFDRFMILYDHCISFNCVSQLATNGPNIPLLWSLVAGRDINPSILSLKDAGILELDNIFRLET